MSSSSSPTFAMTGALAWRVKHINKSMIARESPGIFPLCAFASPSLSFLCASPSSGKNQDHMKIMATEEHNHFSCSKIHLQIISQAVSGCLQAVLPLNPLYKL
ncbi:hypothetical protein AKJ16_DCAP08941 [Drosera capensis]